MMESRVVLFPVSIRIYCSFFFFFVWNGISEFSQFFYRVYSPSFPFLLLYFCSIRA